MKEQLDFTTEEDEFFNYCHQKYLPNALINNKLRSNNLLINSFDFGKCSQDFYRLIEVIKEKVGINNTVWGIKKIDNNLSWEFYFYNHGKKDPRINISNLLYITRPFFALDIEVDEKMPYFMFSMEITHDLFIKKILDGLDVYTGYTNNDRNMGFNYFLDKSGKKLKNHYTFYDAGKDVREIMSNIKGSIFVDFHKIRLNELLLPELVDCKTICIAKKPENDCIYYSGININQFLFFLEKFDYPENLVSFIRKYKSKLDHLQYDVGFDYRFRENKLEIIKSGYYGTF